MKRFFPLLSLGLILALTACERPFQEAPTINTDFVSQPSDNPMPTDPAVTGDTPEAPTDGAIATPTPFVEVIQPTTEPPLTTDPPTAATPTIAVAEPATPTDESGNRLHTVQAGETLGRLAVLYGVSVEDIAAANNLVNVDNLDVDQQLVIPPAGYAEQVAPNDPATSEERVHVVRAGETLYRIGLLYGFTVEELAAYNGLANPNALDLGQEIRIPPVSTTGE